MSETATLDALAAENYRLAAENTALKAAARLAHHTRTHATLADGQAERDLALAAMGALLNGGRQIAVDLVHQSARPHLLAGIVLDEYHRLYVDWCRRSRLDPLAAFQAARLAERRDQ